MTGDDCRVVHLSQRRKENLLTLFQLRCRPRLAENLRVTMTRDAFEACHRLTLRVVTREQGSYCHVFLIVFNLPYMYVTILG